MGGNAFVKRKLSNMPFNKNKQYNFVEFKPNYEKKIWRGEMSLPNEMDRKVWMFPWRFHAFVLMRLTITCSILSVHLRIFAVFINLSDHIRFTEYQTFFNFLKHTQYFQTFKITLLFLFNTGSKQTTGIGFEFLYRFLKCIYWYLRTFFWIFQIIEIEIIMVYTFGLDYLSNFNNISHYEMHCVCIINTS